MTFLRNVTFGKNVFSVPVPSDEPAPITAQLLSGTMLLVNVKP